MRIGRLVRGWTASVVAATAVATAAYLASVGPVTYGEERGWIPWAVAGAYARPATAVRPDGLWAGYVRWWSDLGYRHRTGEDPVYIYVRIER